MRRLTSQAHGRRSRPDSQTLRNSSEARFSRTTKSTPAKNGRLKTATHWRSFRLFPADEDIHTRMDIFEITREPIDKLGLEKRLLTGAAGAVVTFDGVVRDNTKGRRVVSLQYEAYEPMAVKEMRRIGDEIHERWPDVARVGVIHRFGPLNISQSQLVF